MSRVWVPATLKHKPQDFLTVHAIVIPASSISSSGENINHVCLYFLPLGPRQGQGKNFPYSVLVLFTWLSSILPLIPLDDEGYLFKILALPGSSLYQVLLRMVFDGCFGRRLSLGS